MTKNNIAMDNDEYYLFGMLSASLFIEQIIVNQQIHNVIFKMQLQAIKCMQLLISPTKHGIESNLPFQPLNCNLIV